MGADLPSSPAGKVVSSAIGPKVGRKLRAQRLGDRSVWFSFGMIGMIGWTVAIPTFLGAAAGLWIDHRHPGAHSWTLALLVAGLVLGCAQAGHWVAREQHKIKDEETKAQHE